MMEVELRFSVDKAATHSLNHRFSGEECKRESNETIYFDSPDQCLWRRGIEFRIRRNADGIKQTVKCADPSHALFARAEHEINLTDMTPNRRHLEAAVPAKLRALVEAANFAPVFTTSVQRRKQKVECHGSVIERVFDHGEIRVDSKSAPIDDVEYELVRGTPSDLAGACLDFLSTTPGTLQTEGKAARGYHLLSGTAPEPVFASKVRISPETPIPAALMEIMRSAFGHALANHAALTETGAAEAVHQMRVGLRRLRSAITAFEPCLDTGSANGLLAETKTLFTLLGHVRDADVFLAESLERFPESGLNARRRDLLRREISRYRERSLAELVAHLNSPEFARFAVQWYGWIEGEDWLRHGRPIDHLVYHRPVAEFAVNRLETLRRKLFKRAHKALRGGVDDWHRARIAAKKLRYAGEPLSQVVEAEGRGMYTKQLARLQDKLGQFNDLCNVGPFLEGVRPGVGPARSRAFGEAAAFCTGWSAAALEHTVDELRDYWRKFETKAHGK